MIRCCFCLFGLFLSLLLTGCGTSHTFAPVVEVEAQQHPTKPGAYRVKSGDTLYSIAWAFSQDYRELAARNDLSPPYHLKIGQIIVVSGKVVKKNYSHKKPRHHYTPSSTTLHWAWPAKGKIINKFSTKRGGNKGINIAGQYGESVHAAAAGTVVYRGSGLRPYGLMIIIKHDDNYFSAYAFNRRLLVKLGQEVKQGQIIAKMGRNDAGQVMLHFEIRRDGKPVNPLHYLPTR